MLGGRRREGALATGLSLALLLLLGSLLGTPAGLTQGACEEDPDLPHCSDPMMEVSAPGRVSADREALRGGEAAHPALAVNVTNQGAEELEVSLEAGNPTGPIEAQGTEAAVPAQTTVAIPVNLTVPPSTPAGSYPLPLYVNTSGTNTHSPASEQVETQLFVPWWTTGGVDWVWGTGGGLHVELSLTGFRANGPVDLLVATPDHTSQPRLLETGERLAQGQATTASWIVTLDGDPENVDLHVLPVVATGGGLSCLEPDTGALAGFDEARPGEGCQQVAGGTFGTTGQVGGWAGVLVLVAMGVLLLGMVGAVGLGLFVLRRGGPGPPARALGSYLVVAGLGFIPLAARFLLQEYLGIGVAVQIVSDWMLVPLLLTVVALSAAILTFALSYPTVHPRLRGSRRWPALPLVPSTILGTGLLVLLLQDLQGAFVWTMVIAMSYLVICATLATLVFRRRARAADTDLQEQRLSFMFRAVGVPLSLGGLAVLAITLAGLSGSLAIVGTGVLQVGMALLALLPVLGMAWGLLKYKVVDLERGLRITVSRGFVGASLIAVFFVASEAAETFFSETIGPYLGLLAAGLLVLALVPLERFGQRLASQVVPEPPDADSYRSFRRMEVYRATYEEATADGTLSEREQQTLSSLAESLDLSASEVAFVEAEVRREREGQTEPPGAGAAAG